MIKKLIIHKYRKFNREEFDFDKEINIISGTNGTCKTSLLHLIGNSFQKVNSTAEWIKDKKYIEIITKINKMYNPKIERLTRGDAKYNNPAYGHSGALYSCEYINNLTLDFRKHNTVNSTPEKITNRFSLKPGYKKSSNESLPMCPVIYLGIFRLYPFGEFSGEIDNIKIKLPEEHLLEVAKLYETFTKLTISINSLVSIGDIKRRASFSSNKDGIDSNTISSGEDNLFIILNAMVSLKLYFESIESKNDIESVLLIDEIDATLHPAFQIKLFKYFREYSKKYKIQIFFTTHSLTLLDYAMNNNIIPTYLINEGPINEVKQLKNPTIDRIEMRLKTEISDNLNSNKCIPIFTEDDEARFFLTIIFDCWFHSKDNFKKVKSLFHLANANVSCHALESIFKDNKLVTTSIRAVCILDGDRNNDLKNNIITLPGKKAPELLVFQYSIKLLLDTETDFWEMDCVDQLSYTREYFVENIKPEIDQIDISIAESKSKNKSTKGMKREKNKALFKKHKKFFNFVLEHWINLEENQKEIEIFYNNLQILFFKIAPLYGINRKLWS